ncbi:MAG TPA: Ig-like domain-containing protein, partial [Silvibacterium sp.]|nr:Ig-like domain-containing protein [Silvibacterium sp.]
MTSSKQCSEALLREAWDEAAGADDALAFGFLSGCASGAGPSSTLVVVGSTQSKVASGTAVTFTTQVSGGNKTPTGSVIFFDGTTVLGNAVALSNGQASLSVSNLTVGTHSITAAYSGDSSHTASA